MAHRLLTLEYVDQLQPFNPVKSVRSLRGFTVVELIVASGLLALFAAAAVASMTQMNRFATAGKLRTLALGVAKQRIDEILTIKWTGGAFPPIAPPFIIASVPGSPVPASPDLNAGVVVTLNDDALNTGPQSTLDLAIPARRQTYLQAGPRSTRAVVRVVYTYRGRPYTVELITFRTLDET